MEFGLLMKDIPVYASCKFEMYVLYNYSSYKGKCMYCISLCTEYKVGTENHLRLPQCQYYNVCSLKRFVYLITPFTPVVKKKVRSKYASVRQRFNLIIKHQTFAKFPNPVNSIDFCLFELRKKNSNSIVGKIFAYWRKSS